VPASLSLSYIERGTPESEHPEPGQTMTMRHLGMPQWGIGGDLKVAATLN
jgi:hypothetical protein